MAFENDQIARRHEELEQLEAAGVEVYPYSYDKTHDAAAAVELHSDDDSEMEVSVAGRIVSLRRMGKAAFCHIQDQSGRIQLYLKRDELENYDHLKLFDLGDIIGCRGTLFRTRTGEVSVHAVELRLLAKALVPLPVPKEERDEEGNVTVHNQFADKELRYRKRYVDLLVNPQVRETFIKRATMISGIRRYLDQRGYLEVETPVLQKLYGGAAARPFETHMNALDLPLYLRISLELNLKRLMVGGFEGVYELGKNFRNEGLDRTHNPEFTMLELYVAWRDYNWMAGMVENMILEVATAVNGRPVGFSERGEEIDLTPPFRRATMQELVRESVGVDILELDRDGLLQVAEKNDVEVDPKSGKGRIIDEIFSELVQPKLIEPVFVYDHPVEMVPLAKRHRDNPDLVEVWELIIDGKEIGPCFSELNDPRDQRQRFREQAELRASGDDEAMLIDEDFLEALEVGMPPAAGMGMGIDRLAMLLTANDSIRDVIFFPMMRPRSSEGSGER